MEINSQLEKNRARLQDLCAANHVRLLYLIGSQARGQALVMSDVDFGVTFDSRIPTNKRGESLETLSADLMKIVGRNDVDLVDLDRAPALLKHRAATEGILLFQTNHDAHADFLVKALGEYDDTRSLREAVARSLTARYG